MIAVTNTCLPLTSLVASDLLIPKIIMTTSINFTTFEIVTLSLNLLTFVLFLCLFVRTHTGDCRGTLSQKLKRLMVREAKLSMHERPHDDQI